MRIHGWRVDGFGVLNSFLVDDLEQGLTVVTGPNEAGKTTLLAFIQGVLFGFPDGRRRLNQYEPVHGGKHGGALFLLDEQGGRWTLERYKAERGINLIRPDGSPGEDHELAHLLGGADERFFGSVFAFGLDELNSINLLTEDAVKDRVFSAAVVGAGQSARAALRELDERRARLWKPRANCEIRSLANAAREQQSRLRNMQREAEKVVHQEAWVDKLAGEATNRRDILEINRRQQKQLVGLLELWPLRNRVAECDDELAELSELGVPLGLDTAVIERFARLEVSFNTLEGEEKTAQDAVEAALRNGWPQPLSQTRLETAAPMVRELAADVGVAEANQTRLNELESRLSAEEQNLNGHLAKLGSGWNRGRLEGFETTIPSAAEIRQHSQALLEAEQQQTSAVDLVANLESSLRQSRSNLTAVEAELDALGLPLPEEEVQNRQKALRTLRTNLLELGRLSSEMSAGPTAESPSPEIPSSPLWPRMILFLGVALLAIGVGLGALGTTIAAAICGGVGLVLAIIGAFGWTRGSSAAKTAASDDAASASMAETRQRITATQNSIEAIAIVLGLAPNPSAEEVEAYADGLTAAAGRQKTYADLRTQRDKVKADHAAIETELDEARGNFTEANAVLALAQQNWLGWKSHHRVDHQLNAEEVTDFFAVVTQAKTSLATLVSLEAEEARLSNVQRVWQTRLNDLFQELEIETSSPTATLSQLEETLAELLAASSSLHRARESKHKVGQDLQSVLDQVGASSFEEFQKFAQRATSHAALETERAALVQRIADEVGWGETASKALAELERGRPQEWKDQLEKAEIDQPQLEEAYELAIRAHQDASRELDKQLASTEIAEVALELEGTRSELAEAVSQWRVLSGARTLIEETLETYERDRQPAVLRRAEAMFSEITDGHYQRLQAVDGEISVVDKAEHVLAANDLSRGTLEQLYLCLRFGLAAEMASRTPLPFVLDDVLVNFDPERVRQTASVVGTIAAQQQVFAFTCQPASVEALLTVSPEARVIELPRHGGHS